MALCALRAFVAMAAPAAATTQSQPQPVQAPVAVSRLSGMAQEVSPGVWEITLGDAVPAWLHANAPSVVSSYNFLRQHGAAVDTTLVKRRPVACSTTAV